MTDLKPLGGITLAQGQVCLEPMADAHLAGLRSACAEDQAIWDIYPVSMIGEHFSASVTKMLAPSSRLVYAVIDADAERVVGMTRFINPNTDGVVEIGGTYIAPSVRGTGFNATMKKLLLDHAFACGNAKVEFRVDTRNARSMAAVLKLGAQQEGILRKNRVTWTGFRRDTAVFGLLSDEWS